MDFKNFQNNDNLNTKREILRLLEAKKRLKEDTVLENIVPSTIQRLFLLSKAKTALLLGSNRSGKSFILAADALIRATGIIPKTLEHEYPKKFIRHGEYLLSALTFPMSHGVVQKKIEQLLPKRMNLDFNKEFKERTFKCGCLFIHKSCDQGRERYQGYSSVYISHDEEPPKDIADEAFMRTTDLSGIIRFGFTPVKGMTWTYSELYQKAKRYYSTVNKHNIPEDHGIVHTPEEIKLLKDRRLVVKENPSKDADENIEVFQMTIYDNPHLPDVEIQNTEQKLQHDPLQYNSRILGRFGKITGSEIFPISILQKRQQELPNVFKRGDIVNGVFKESIHGNLLIFKDLKSLRGYKFAIGADVSEGLPEGDYSCAQILSYNTLEQWGIWHGKPNPEEFARILVELGKFFNRAWIAPERNFHGIGVVHRIRDHFKYSRLFSEYDIPQSVITASFKPTVKKYGWSTDAKTKPIMIQDLALAIGNRQLILNDFNTLEELMTYTYQSNHTMGALGGCHDDRVVALAIALQIIKRRGIVHPRTRLDVTPLTPDSITGYP